jgi:hypothetical protein
MLRECSRRRNDFPSDVLTAPEFRNTASLAFAAPSQNADDPKSIEHLLRGYSENLKRQGYGRAGFDLLRARLLAA